MASAKAPATGAPYTDNFPAPRVSEFAALADEVPVVDEPAPEPVADDEPPAAAPAVVPFPPVVPKAERGTAVIDVHCAALLSCPSWYGRKLNDFCEVLSWTSEETPAKYCALASLTEGAARVCVLFDSTLMT